MHEHSHTLLARDFVRGCVRTCTHIGFAVVIAGVVVAVAMYNSYYRLTAALQTVKGLCHIMSKVYRYDIPVQWVSRFKSAQDKSVRN